MLKVIAASTVFVLVIGSGAFANVIGDITQQQDTMIGLHNDIELLHGSQAASSLQNLVVNNNQNAQGVCEAQAQESLFAAIGQVGNTCGNCGLVGVVQALQLQGQQAQEVTEGVGPKAQMQGLGMQASQTLAKADGQGAADALHTIVANACQEAENPAGELSESSTLMGMQVSNVAGAPGATSIVDTSMSVITTQTQSAL